MAVKQREVYLLPDPVSGAQHPFIVLSALEANQYEDTFIGVMITSSARFNDEHSFLVSDAMFEQPLHKQDSHVRMHLITLAFNQDIVGKRLSVMKGSYFNRMMEQIGETIFNYSFKAME